MMKRLLFTALALCCAALSSAGERAVAPVVDAGGLPALGATWVDGNPYRGRAAAALAVGVGRDAYNQACARCHGADAATNAAPAPDLRNLDRGCRRIAEPALKTRCMADNDVYFAKTVRNGKIILGVVHMPPWDGVLQQELAWAIQLFVESQAAERQK